MADWVDHESEQNQERRLVSGRCGHGFVPGLCVVEGCAGSTAVSGQVVKLCRQCGRAKPTSRERYCADCVKSRRRAGVW
jgi:hypothetical protein